MRTLKLALVAAPLLALSSLAGATTCGESPVASPLPVRTTPVPPLAHGLAGAPVAFGSPYALLADSRDEALALDLVLLRLRNENCVKDAYAGYKPRTQFDNTPWRFNSKPGTKFSAAEFDAWMKSRGVRVARGATPGAAATATTPAPAPAPSPADTGAVQE